MIPVIPAFMVDCRTLTTAMNGAGASAQFIFLPGVPIQMIVLLPVLMSADALGVLLGWRYLDHLGHLGGTAFGEHDSTVSKPFCTHEPALQWCIAGQMVPIMYRNNLIVP